MDKMSRKPAFKVSSIPTEMAEPINIMDTISKWVPLICAGSAIGIGIFALKEIKNVRKELKKPGDGNEKLEKKMEYMEQQLKSISEFLKKKDHQDYVKKKKSPVIIKNEVPVIPEKVKIINEPEEENPDDYEEVEVTDDEID